MSEPTAEHPSEQPHQPDPPAPRPRKRRWPRRLLLAFLLLLVALVAIPFLFPTALVRLALQRLYGPFAPQVAHASLGPAGSLDIEGLALHEPDGTARPLVSADHIRIRFGWGELIDGRVESVDVEGLRLQLRSAPGRPLTVTSLAPQDASPRPLWIDRLSAAGTVELDPALGPIPVDPAIPVELRMSMSGQRETPVRLVRLESSPGRGRQGRITLRAEVGAGRIDVEELWARDLDLTAPADVLAQLKLELPEEITGPLHVQVRSARAMGVVDLPADRPPSFAGKMSLDDASVTSPGAPPLVAGLSAAGELRLPLDASAPSGLWVKQGGRVRLDSMTYGAFAVRDFSAAVRAADGLVEAESLRFVLMEGQIDGRASIDAGRGALATVALDVKRLDLGRLLSNVLEKSGGRGTMSGTVTLRGGPDGAVRGTARLEADGPGKLMLAEAGPLQKALSAGKSEDLMAVITGQLKNYPYESGRITLTNESGQLAIILENFHRKPVQPGEPGYGMEIEYGGRKVLANQTVQIPDLALIMGEKTLGRVLLFASGLKVRWVDSPPGE